MPHGHRRPGPAFRTHPHPLPLTPWTAGTHDGQAEDCAARREVAALAALASVTPWGPTPEVTWGSHSWAIPPPGDILSCSRN